MPRNGANAPLRPNYRPRQECQSAAAIPAWQHQTMKSEVGAVPGYLSTPLPCQPHVYTRPPPATIMDHGTCPARARVHPQATTCVRVPTKLHRGCARRLRKSAAQMVGPWSEENRHFPLIVTHQYHRGRVEGNSWDSSTLLR
ncbi:hypothetical protein KM043_013140 [Ampulex compressa]|nr:hypothetical protein KM043_013140 [Ampulex compressa]